MTAPVVRVSTCVWLFCFPSLVVVHDNRFHEIFEKQEQP